MIGATVADKTKVYIWWRDQLLFTVWCRTWRDAEGNLTVNLKKKKDSVKFMYLNCKFPIAEGFFRTTDFCLNMLLLITYLCFFCARVWSQKSVFVCGEGGGVNKGGYWCISSFKLIPSQNTGNNNQLCCWETEIVHLCKKMTSARKVARRRAIACRMYVCFLVRWHSIPHLRSLAVGMRWRRRAAELGFQHWVAALSLKGGLSRSDFREEKSCCSSALKGTSWAA